MSNSNLPTLNTAAAAGPKKTKGGTVAERVVWMTRTSDVHGSHLKTDLDSYLALIRRKIQEKCATTMELITQIRRNKIGESGHVTPNEFRFTLIKFGIIFPQPLVDKIFNVFDSDRSGTMDFDEFAMWIMNSEFRPAMKNSNIHEDTPRTVLRGKLQNVVQQNRNLFINMKRQISFLQFVSDITRLQLPLTDKEARSIFQTLDPKDSGYIDSSALLTWADTGRIVTVAEVVKPVEIPAHNLEELIKKIIGRNNKQLESSFSHIQLGQGIKISFDEFRRCLLNAGVGKNIHDVRQLFMALGGAAEGLADIDLMFRKLSPMIADPVSEVSEKRLPTSTVSTSRADRFLRERMRKCFKQVKMDIDATDPTGCGYIDAERLYKILVKRCMPLTFQDFRFVVQQIKKEPGTTRIDYQHFLHGYNPQNAPHALEGSVTLKTYEKNPLPNGLSIPPTNQKTDSAATTLSNTDKFASTMPTPLASHNTSAGSNANTGGMGGSLRSAKTTDDIDMRSSTGMSRTQSDNMLNAGYTAKYSGPGNNSKNNELKRIWQSVLRECHRSDPERCGQVSRNVFIAALEKSDVDRAMTAEAMNKLADTYTLSSGLVNYLHLFRSYLNDVGGSASLSKSQSLALFKSTGDLAKSGELKPIHPVHPWDYGYERQKHPVAPYWQQANTMPRLETVKPVKSTATVPPPNEKGANDLTTSEKEALLSQYNPKVLELCAKCYALLAPIWRPLRNAFKKDQIASQRGSILTPNFLSILEANGIMLTKGELATIVRVFRGLGMQDVVKYDEFLRVCMLSKDR